MRSVKNLYNIQKICKIKNAFLESSNDKTYFYLNFILFLSIFYKIFAYINRFIHNLIIINKFNYVLKLLVMIILKNEKILLCKQFL